MKKNGIFDLLYPPAVWMTGRLRPDRMEGSRRILNEEIMALAGGRKESVREYYVRKTQKFLAASLLCMVLLTAVIVSMLTRDKLVPDSQIRRPAYQDPARREELLANVAGADEEKEILLEVGNRQYSKLQAEQLLDSAEEELEEVLLQDNPSRDEVRSSLAFPRSLAGGAVKAEWMTTPYGIISDQGKLEGQTSGKVPDEGCLVEIEADLSCQGQKRTFKSAVMVFPEILSEDEMLWKALQEAVDEADSEQCEEEYLNLPGEVNGKKITWKFTGGQEYMLLILLLSGTPLFLAYRSDAKVKEEAQNRNEPMQADYPDLMWKMTMLLGAGLTIQGVFQRITSDYRSEKKKGRYRYVYEEMLYTCREMKSGVPEAKAYENFGRRCGLPGYIKLGSMLSANLKKGSRGLAAALEQEALSTSQERRNLARQRGEKAGTKLLMPMILMLIVVLVVLIAPAVLNMQ